jgi:N-acetylmuramoyl-L-alanine amidase
MTLALQPPIPQPPVAMISPSMDSSSWQDPGPNAPVLQVPSPNYNARPADVSVDTIVLHSTVIPTLERTVFAFTRRQSGVSAHFTIGKDGSIVQHVSTFDRAWHAGPSRDHLGRENLNDFSIGIELVNLNDGLDPYPEIQVKRLRDLIASIKRRHEIKYITSHEAIAVPKGRKSDPAGFQWDQVAMAGVELIP